jgi:O-antigen/teichoic acid export membrane protein
MRLASSSVAIVRNWATQAGSQLIAIPLSLLFVAVVARRLGPEEYGLYQLALSFPGLLATAVPLGMNVYFSRDLAQHPEDAQKYAAYGFGLTLISSLSVYFVLQIVATGIGLPESSRLPILISGVSAVAAAASLLSSAIFRAFERMQLDALLGLSERILATALGLVAAYVWSTSLALVSVLVLTSVLRFVGSYVLVRRQIGRFSLQFNWHESSSFFRSGWPFLIAGYGDSLYNYIGPTILAKVSSPTEVGTYAAAWRSSSLLGVLAISFANVTLPVLARNALRGKEHMRVIVRGAVPLLLFSAGACASLAALLAVPISGLVYGDRFAGTGLVLAILVFMLPSSFVKYFLGNTLMSLNEQPYITRLLVVVACAGLLLNVILGSIFGAVGVALALLACEYGVSLGLLVRLAHVGAGVHLPTTAASWLGGIAPGLIALNLPLPLAVRIGLACVALVLAGYMARGHARRYLAPVRAGATA